MTRIRWNDRVEAEQWDCLLVDTDAVIVDGDQVPALVIYFSSCVTIYMIHSSYYEYYSTVL